MSFNLNEGVYIHFGETHDASSIRRVDLIYSDIDASDFFVPNGKFGGKSFQLISYITDVRLKADTRHYITPITELPASETQGLPELLQRGVSGGCIANLPPRQDGYIPRKPPESSLYSEIVDDNQHRIITLIGRGGIGKTWLTLAVLNKIAHEEQFDAILWFSARDIDLLPDGAKQVKPHILTEDDIAKEFSTLIAPYLLSYADIHNDTFSPVAFLRENMNRSPLGKLLFVFDNFETVKSPVELYNWIDSYLRLPNKAVITTRFREFKGDYPVELQGMSAEECHQLIQNTSKTLGITHLLTASYIDEIN